MLITEYFLSIEQQIANCPLIISKEIYFDQRSKHLGFIKGSITFIDKSTLYFKEFINCEISIKKFKYGYHYQKTDKMIFRYDNYPHTNLPSQHKHINVQENIIKANEPQLSDILNEICNYIAST